jgi:diaminopimelate epimerase
MIPTGSNSTTITVTVQVLDFCGNASTCVANVLLKKAGTLSNSTNNENTITPSENETPTTSENQT